MADVKENLDQEQNQADMILEDDGPEITSDTTDLEAEVEVQEEEDERDTRIKNLMEGNQKMSADLLRSQADYENLKRRSARERFEEIKRAKKSVFLSFLEVLDNFERALTTEDKSHSSFVQGIEMIHKQFVDVLSQNSVYEINAEGTPFNPHMHEAMVQQPTNDFEENLVVQVFQKGYSFNGELLRPSQVSVATPVPDEPPPPFISEPFAEEGSMNDTENSEDC